jgi:hypothetical protein
MHTRYNKGQNKKKKEGGPAYARRTGENSAGGPAYFHMSDISLIESMSNENVLSASAHASRTAPI